MNSLLELIHASAPRGVRDAGGGYTTVAHTQGMPASVLDALEGVSALAVRAAARGASVSDLASYRIAPMRAAGEAWVVITRAVPVPADYTGRPARLTHHVLLRGGLATPGLVARLLLREDTFVARFDGGPRLLAPRQVDGEATLHGAAAGCGLGALTIEPEAWARHLAGVASVLRPEPFRLLLPSSARLAPAVAAVVAMASRVDALRIAAGPAGGSMACSLMMAVVGRESPGPVDVDWSGGRNGSPCPAAACGPGAPPAPPDGPAAVARTSSVRKAPPQLDLSGLGPPVAVRSQVRTADAKAPSPARRRAPTVADESVPERPMPWFAWATVAIAVAVLVASVALYLASR